ncbi:MAG: hypothetical protein ACRCVI_01320 [Mycoplasmoidaceae bacterium]
MKKSFKLKYLPGIRPTPMLVVFNDHNLQAFEDIKNECLSPLDFKRTFINDFHHLWNPNAYLIYNDQNEILAFVYTNIAYLFYLLRSLNKPLMLEINANDLEALKKEFQDWIEELEITEDKK